MYWRRDNYVGAHLRVNGRPDSASITKLRVTLPPGFSPRVLSHILDSLAIATLIIVAAFLCHPMLKLFKKSRLNLVGGTGKQHHLARTSL
jgi:hypothetical protein